MIHAIRYTENFVKIFILKIIIFQIDSKKIKVTMEYWRQVVQQKDDGSVTVFKC